MKTPLYFGGMILSDIDTAYNYETQLVKMLKYRFDKYSKKWGLFTGMEALLKGRRYSEFDFHVVPSDPLIHIPEDFLYWKFLRLKSKKLQILKLEVYKYYRRHKRYPL